MEGLFEIGIRACLQSLQTVFVGGAGSNHDNRNVTDQFVGTHAATQFEAVHAGHHHVGDDEVGHQLPRLFEGFFAIGGKVEAIAGIGGKLALHVARHLGRVFHNEDVRAVGGVDIAIVSG